MSLIERWEGQNSAEEEVIETYIPMSFHLMTIGRVEFNRRENDWDTDSQKIMHSL